MASPVRVIIGDLKTGRRIVDVPYTTCTWDNTLNAIGNISAVVPLYDRRARKLGLRAAATPAKSFIAIEQFGRYPQAGPIWRQEFDEDAGTLTLTGAGILSYFNHRTVNAPSALGGLPLLKADGSPDTTMNSVFTDISLGTRIKRLLQLATSAVNGSVPLTYPDDVADLGTTDTIVGADLKFVGSAIADIVAQSDGPDFILEAFRTTDGLGLQWQLRTGTPGNPRLFANKTHKWDNSVARRSVRGLKVTVDGQDIGSHVWTTGGRSADVALISLQRNAALAAAGYPVLEIVDSSHSDATKLSTLDRYGKETLRISQGPTEFWTFQVRADRAPFLGEYAPGDYCTIRIGDNNPYVPKGNYTRRILSLSGDGDGKWVSVTTGEVLVNV